MEQFGIFLLLLNPVKYQVDLCPVKVNGTVITEQRRQLMASSLYQKLQNVDVIPMEYTSIRNIVNWFAEHNDGYKVLYAMLELVHPALQWDAVILLPKSHECNDDIHTYYQKFDAWLCYEAYANRPYSAREQVNHFIRELSSAFCSSCGSHSPAFRCMEPLQCQCTRGTKDYHATKHHWALHEGGTGTIHVPYSSYARKEEYKKGTYLWL